MSCLREENRKAQYDLRRDRRSIWHVAQRLICSVRKIIIKGNQETYEDMRVVSVKQVTETTADAILSIYGEIDAEGEEEGSSESTREGLKVCPVRRCLPVGF